MKNCRLRLPVKNDYVNALGMATFAFATYEWQVVYCCEKIKPGSLKKLTSLIKGKFLTAGQIASDFTNLTNNMRSSKERETLKAAAAKFSAQVVVRNKIIHGKPCTDPNGDARLNSASVIEIVDLENAADEFATFSIELNGIYNGFLSTYKPQ